MTGGSKIIGMWRDRDEGTSEENIHTEATEDHSTLELGVADKAISLENEGIAGSAEDEKWSHYSDEELPVAAGSGYLMPSLFGLLAVIWTAFFGWANRDIFATLPTMQEGISLTTQWCLPIVTLAVVYMLVMRNSSKEAGRFADIAASLREESRLLEARLKTVNGELSIAREFLASESRELEFFADQSSKKLNSAASLIKTSLDDGLSNMTKLDEVGDAAYKNLEQLRDHLPVVINTAKDVTNQIGNSGRTAQAEVAAMVATLKRVGDVGTAAKKSINALTGESQQSLELLSDTASKISDGFERDLADAEVSSNKIASVLQKSSTEVLDALNKARAELANESSESSAALRSELEDLQGTLTSVGSFADAEETRLKALVSELNENIAKVAHDVSQLDDDSGEKTAKLAFAMTALEQNSVTLLKALDQGHGAADGMIERMEKLIIALDSGARELDETLPAAFERLDKKSSTSEATLQNLTKHAVEAGSVADAIAEKLANSDQAIVNQQDKLKALLEDSTTTNQSLNEQISELAISIQNIREQNEALAESAGEKLISALLRVKDTAKQASEHSRDAMEKAISGSTETFEKVSEEALGRIIDEKIGSIAPKLETAVSNAVASTETTASHLTDQLNAIENMTTQLEQRILFAKEKAEQSSDENFTRRVALLTESLNSTAIDVSKILSNDVTDTEWAAYLKGDRGIFTRRAVRLLDNGEVREILAQYEANDEFREHVNRYIHDFEAMLRGVLSTRDGSAISVTLLSSDIGKLYVALAQAIERLRS